MNKIFISCRVTGEVNLKDIERKDGSGSFKMASANVAIIDPKTDGNYVRVTATGKQAESMKDYWFKGCKLIVEGRLLNNSYTNREGVKAYSTEIQMDGYEFCESKAVNDSKRAQHTPQVPQGQAPQQYQQAPPQQQYQPTPPQQQYQQGQAPQQYQQASPQQQYQPTPPQQQYQQAPPQQQYQQAQAPQQYQQATPHQQYQPTQPQQQYQQAPPQQQYQQAPPQQQYQQGQAPQQYQPTPPQQQYQPTQAPAPQPTQAPVPQGQGWASIPEEIDEELPFN